MQPYCTLVDDEEGINPHLSVQAVVDRFTSRVAYRFGAPIGRVVDCASVGLVRKGNIGDQFIMMSIAVAKIAISFVLHHVFA